jgi:dGTPase
LQGKTQLFPGVESDFFRNRLTHSLEVAQIACGIASRLNATAVQDSFPGSSIDEDLVEFAAIAHDLGHPPFGHNGEKALDELMRDYGGFEGNAQTLRIIAAVEQKLSFDSTGALSGRFGLDLTYRTLASVLKYDRAIPAVRSRGAKLAKGYYGSEANLVAEIKRRVAPSLGAGKEFKTIECAIMDIADDIAYSTYDLEDSLHAGFVTPMKLAWAIANDASVAIEVKTKTNKALKEAGYTEVDETKELLDVIARVFGTSMPPTVTRLLKGEAVKPEDALLVDQEAWSSDQTLVTDGLARTRFTADRVGKLIAAVKFEPNEEIPALSGVSMQREELLQVEVLKHLNYELVIRSPRLAVVEHRGKELVTKIFKTLAESDGSLLPDDWRARHADAVKASVSEARRLICDYVACMTDRYAAELHARLFGEGSTIFKPL